MERALIWHTHCTISRLQFASQISNRIRLLDELIEQAAFNKAFLISTTFLDEHLFDW